MPFWFRVLDYLIFLNIWRTAWLPYKGRPKGELIGEYCRHCPVGIDTCFRSESPLAFIQRGRIGTVDVVAPVDPIHTVRMVTSDRKRFAPIL
jgi:hypothetical protein